MERYTHLGLLPRKEIYKFPVQAIEILANLVPYNSVTDKNHCIKIKWTFQTFRIKYEILKKHKERSMRFRSLWISI